MLTEWRQPSVRPEMVAQFDVYRSTDNVNFNYLRTVPAQQTDLSDYAVDAEQSLLLQDPGRENLRHHAGPSAQARIRFCSGAKWMKQRQVHLHGHLIRSGKTGVEYYILEKLDEQGHWQVLRQVDGQTLRYDYQE